MATDLDLLDNLASNLRTLMRETGLNKTKLHKMSTRTKQMMA